MPMEKIIQSQKNRILLVVDPEKSNWEYVETIFKEKFITIFAKNAIEGIQLLEKYFEKISVILLDVDCPDCDAKEFLRFAQKGLYLASIPVLVTSSSLNLEEKEEYIKMGAIGYVQKPYSPGQLIQTIHNTISHKDTLLSLYALEFDYLTELLTMASFMKRGKQYLEAEENTCDFLLCKVKNYTELTDVFGEKKGKEHLQYIAEQLKKTFPEYIIARNNHLFFLLGKSLDQNNLRNLKKINYYLENNASIANLRTEFCLYKNVDKNISISILCNKLKMCIRFYEKRLRSNVYLYDKKAEHEWKRQESVLLNFSNALKEKEFRILVQPKIDTKTGKVVSAEALVRWIDAQGNMVSPNDFIPLLERDGLINKLDQYMFENICDIQNKRRLLGKIPLPISINLSRNSMYQEDLIPLYRKIVREKQVDLNLVPLELTESALISDTTLLFSCQQLVDSGFIIHLDDFGSGFSSLASLANLPISVLKIDKSLIDIMCTEKGYIVLENVILLAKKLGMKVVAEGVEKKEQVEVLKKMDCDYIQGYYYAPPMPLEDFEKFVENKQ